MSAKQYTLLKGFFVEIVVNQLNLKYNPKKHKHKLYEVNTSRMDVCCEILYFRMKLIAGDIMNILVYIITYSQALRCATSVIREIQAKLTDIRNID